MQLGECTVITRPGYAPGMPGFGHGLKRVTTRYFGIARTSSAESAGTSAAAARNLRRSTRESMRRIIVACLAQAPQKRGAKAALKRVRRETRSPSVPALGFGRCAL